MSAILNYMESNKKPIKETLRNWLIGLGVLAFLGVGFYQMFFAHSNEVGFLGMDKVGRQVFIQSLDEYMHPNADVDSEFHDIPLPLRIISEPLRTTIKFNIQDEREFQATEQGVKMFLNQPANVIVDKYRGKVTMQDAWEIEPSELKKLMAEKKVETVSDLLSGFGFEKFEMYSRDKLIKSVELPKTKNVIHVGGE
ncbi:MAG: hypothetical protein AB1489_39455 [Acidobacteriota bacterium]